MNIEYLLNVFMSIDANSDVVCDTSAHFMMHLYWYKPWYTVLGSKIEQLADDHRSKPACLVELSRLFQSVGNSVRQKLLLTDALKLVREQGDNFQVAHTLLWLSHANRWLGHYKEGIQQIEESMALCEPGDSINQAICQCDLARLLYLVGQIPAAEKAASCTINLLLEKGQEFLVCQFHQDLGDIYYFKGEGEKAVYHFEKALEIATTFKWHSELFEGQYSLAKLFLDNDGFESAHDHIDQAKSHAADDALMLAQAMEAKAVIWFRQHKFEDAVSEALRALNIYEKLGASRDIVDCKGLLQNIEQATAGELLETMPLVVPANSPSSACSMPSSTSISIAPSH